MSDVESGDRPEKLGIREVAVLAGVSHMTVSRVLNGHPNIRPATRQRVMDVIEQLDFKPNSAARALATQRTQRIGVIVDSSVEFGPTSTLRGLEFAARSGGYSVTSVAMQDDASLTPEAAVGHLIAEGVDALCVVAPRSSSVSALRRISIDVPVLVVKAAKDPNFLTVSVDQQLGTTLAVDHLVALGHRDILHLAGPLDWLDARGRERAFHARIEQWGLKVRPIVVGDWTADFGYDYAVGLKGVPEYTAMFVANDEMAFGVVHGFHDRGIRVPEDVSIIGFDDLPLSRHFIPPLTTVTQDFYALGVKAMEVLRAALEGREIPQRSKIPSELVVRASTAPPRSS
ncbi:LacI family DNA-binding transcriptional regulator [Agromyces allii]|uniref:LacI family DNA-binding transcriptional regulator n=1 Tax=Agromyces allii TaxID=393607 RepID=UPI0012FA23BB|nr:LacI family DNA-binding transcriptional regulator [Agromyces allii]